MGNSSSTQSVNGASRPQKLPYQGQASQRQEQRQPQTIEEALSQLQSNVRSIQHQGPLPITVNEGMFEVPIAHIEKIIAVFTAIVDGKPLLHCAFLNGSADTITAWGDELIKLHNNFFYGANFILRGGSCKIEEVSGIICCK